MRFDWLTDKREWCYIPESEGDGSEEIRV